MKKLYLNRRAPNPRKVLVLMQAKGLNIDDMDDIDVIDIDMAQGEHLTEEFTKINPLQLLPVLVLDDGTVLNDSQAICEYLDRVYGERSVMGNDVVQRARVASLRRTAEFEVLYNFMLAFQHTHPSKAHRVDQVPEMGPKSIERAIKVLPYFDNILQNNDYLMGKQLSYADIVLYIALDFGRVLKFDPLAHGTGIARFYKMMDEQFGFKKS
ncbi:glutathione S-transferase family protein [Psychrobacter sp. FDAARGOS_221]|uniref:glutathione S-transferase family protein n=1 Tax=Psychrobacter sp. FDAARGOS_221 TaxID=1975705 RepID=UPI000BB5338D|nr:glutathione S-transferase N-terminal domain-containing protein [Psychrobacter sp. FDAARGOS_221]PNK59753.1 glutathione S-transferase [Psychrobacter sp. FDAARGOS_221]